MIIINQNLDYFANQKAYEVDGLTDSAFPFTVTDRKANFFTRPVGKMKS